MYAGAQIRDDGNFHAALNGTAQHRIPCREVTTFKPGAGIYSQGDKSGNLFQIKTGSVRIYSLLSDGRRQVIAFHLAGETFGFEAGQTRSFFAEAINDTGIVVLEPSLGDISGRLIDAALQCMIRAQEHLLVVGRQNAAERLAAFILEMSHRQNDKSQIELPMTRLDIADYLGMTIETSSRSFSFLKKKGLIRTPSLRCVEIVKIEALRHLCS